MNRHPSHRRALILSLSLLFQLPFALNDAGCRSGGSGSSRKPSPPAAAKAPRATAEAPKASSTSQNETRMIETPSGLKYEDIVVGTGPSPSKGQTVVVHYTGTFPNGKVFDSSVDRGEKFRFPIGVGRVIQGWDEGVGTMKVGGKRRLVIPSHLAYGDRGAGNVIPPGATLHFEVELFGIE